eukprot:SAG22_NODE_247_length_13918_cov_7.885375_6_plen_96_part_00
MAQFSESELRDAHRAIIEAFRAKRTLSSKGVPRWDPANREHALTKYVCDESAHHTRSAWGNAGLGLETAAAASSNGPDGPETDKDAVVGWLNDVP